MATLKVCSINRKRVRASLRFSADSAASSSIRPRLRQIFSKVLRQIITQTTDPAKPAFVPWSSLKEQFGPDYDRMDNFKRVFRTTLKQVATVYKDAKYSMDDKGMRLKNSRPPVLKRYALGRVK